MFRELWEKNKEKFVKSLDPDLVVLFGSYLINSNYNDIDLLVISKLFANQNMYERKRKIYYFFPNLNIDPWCFRDFDYQNKDSILFDIIKNGEILWKK